MWLRAARHPRHVERLDESMPGMSGANDRFQLLRPNRCRRRERPDHRDRVEDHEQIADSFQTQQQDSSGQGMASLDRRGHPNHLAMRRPASASADEQPFLHRI
jgi:hypothetical protein